VISATRRSRLREATAALFKKNRQRGHAAWCDADYDFTCPSHETYPFQWLWDSSFHAIALRHLDPERARSELTSLLANQQDDGFVAHVTFWQREQYEALLSTYSIAYRTPHLSDCMQPPVIAEALELVAAKGADDDWTRTHLAKVERFFAWMRDVRDPDDDGLIATLQPDESGLDHTPKYDDALGVDGLDPENLEIGAFTSAWQRVAARHDDVGRDTARMFAHGAFVVEDVLVNTIWILGLRALARLRRARGDEAQAAVHDSLACKAMAALVEKCWDDDAGLFFDVAGAEERRLTTSTISSLVPLALPDLDEGIAERLLAHVSDPTDYGARYPVPSVSMKEPSFRPGVVGTKLVWRGPSWINTNWYVARGCRQHGREDLAARIELASVELVEQSGFREYYNPFTGEGAGAPDFGWSALALDMVESAP